MAAVSDIDLEPAVHRRADDRMDLALAVDKAAGMAREGMREDVAGAQQRDDALQNRIDILALRARFGQVPKLAEMNVDRQIRRAPDLRRKLDDLDAPAGKAADLGMALDPAHDVRIF